MTGRFSATTCQNLYGFARATQYLVNATQQTSYAIEFTSTGQTALVPLNSGSSFHPAVTRTNRPYFVVVRPGVFGFLITATSGSTATYAISTTRAPDPRSACATTYATTGVRFNSALSSSCETRDILVVPVIAASQRLTVSVTTPSRPVKLELLDATTGTVIDDTTATPGRRTATITWTNGSSATRVRIRISANNVNDLIPIEISP